MKIQWGPIGRIALGAVAVPMSGALASVMTWLCFWAMNWWTTTDAAAGVAVYEFIAYLAIGVGIAVVIFGLVTLWPAPVGVGVLLGVIGMLLLLLNLWLQEGYVWHDWYWWLIYAVGIVVVVVVGVAATLEWHSVAEVTGTPVFWTCGIVLAICVLLGFFPSLCVAISPFFI